MIRSKFRCLELTYHLKQASAKLKPVIAKNDDWQMGSEENAMFWDATPSGECDVRWQSHGDVSLEIGAYYYIDLEEVPEGNDHTWKLWEVSQSESSLGIKLGLGWDQTRPIAQATYQIDIHNEKAWEEFQGKAGSHWEVTFTRAEGNHDGCPYTGLGGLRGMVAS